MRPEVADAEARRELALGHHVLEDSPELDEFALGRHERVVDEDEVGLTAEAVDRVEHVLAQVLELDTLAVRVALLGRDC